MCENWPIADRHLATEVYKLTLQSVVSLVCRRRAQKGKEGKEIEKEQVASATEAFLLVYSLIFSEYILVLMLHYFHM